MSREIEITDIFELRKALAGARTVYVRPFYGSIDAWVKISKTAAKEMLADIRPNTNPDDLGLPSSRFGLILMPQNELYLG